MNEDTQPPSSKSTSPSSRTRALAEELTMLAEVDPQGLAARISRLAPRDLAELALRLPAEQRLPFVTTAPGAPRIVRALPDQDLYLTVRDVGPADAMPLLSLASGEQLSHLVDLEAWRGYDFDGDRAGAWLALLLEAGDDTLRRFLRRADDEFLVLLLQRWVRVKRIEFEDTAEKHGHGESETGDERGGVTPDGNFRFSPARDEHAPAIARLLRMLFTEQPERYAALIDGSEWLLPADAEERALHWRQSRLEEHGFPTMEEAQAIYLPPQGLEVTNVPTLVDEDGRIGASREALRLPAEQALLGPAIDRLTEPHHERVLAEVTAVANRVIIADGRDTGDRTAHSYAMDKVAGTLQLAFEELGIVSSQAAAERLETQPVIELFRVGNERIYEVRGRAARLFHESWPDGDPEALELLDAPARQRLAGLLAVPPLFHAVYEIDQTEELRPFRFGEELSEAEVAMELAENLGSLFVDRLGLDLARIRASASTARAEPIRFSTLWLTLWARHLLDGAIDGRPLSIEEATRFVDSVARPANATSSVAEASAAALRRALFHDGPNAPRRDAVFDGFSRFSRQVLVEQVGRTPHDVPLDPKLVPCLLIDETPST